MQRFADQLADGRLVLVPGDARRDRPALPRPWRIIANPPFKHTADLLRTWLLTPLPGGAPAAIDLLLQDQTARKWSGADGDHTRSSVIAQLWGWPRRLTGIARTDVSPPAHVSLAHWSLQVGGDGPDIQAVQAVDQLLAHAFAGPHSVREALRGIATPAILKKQAKLHRWHADAHPRTVPPQGWLDLARYLVSIGRL
jgi:16S rRNA A1518/A1519 N6-dimethyltransferase RsmA/KsgA/DIM1 with predicted DNA glycosylase/AP lyase activity